MTDSEEKTNQSESTEGKAETSQKKNKSKYRKPVLIALGLIFGVALLTYLIYWLIWGQYRVSTDDAYVNGNIVSLMPQIPGTVTEIYADDTQLVLEGQPIIKLDEADMQVAFQNARAALAERVRQVRQFFENAEQARADLILRQAELKKARLDLKRRIGLVSEKAISREILQHYQTSLQIAAAAHRAAQHRYVAVYSLIENTDVYRHPLVEEAKAEFKKAYLNLQRTTILAPITGYIAKRNVNIGQQVNLQQPMLAIIPLTQIWVDANYKESQLNYLRIGQPVTLSVDAYSNISYHGKIAGLNAGTGAAFAILPPQNATGNWIKIVQRLPVRISLDPQEVKKHPLQLGLSMEVTTDIHNISGSRLADETHKTPQYVTTIYKKQLEASEKLINQILRANAPNLYLSRGRG